MTIETKAKELGNLDNLENELKEAGKRAEEAFKPIAQKTGVTGIVGMSDTGALILYVDGSEKDTYLMALRALGSMKEALRERGRYNGELEEDEQPGFELESIKVN